jgi:hypothetical protein
MAFSHFQDRQQFVAILTTSLATPISISSTGYRD